MTKKYKSKEARKYRPAQIITSCNRVTNWMFPFINFKCNESRSYRSE